MVKDAILPFPLLSSLPSSSGRLVYSRMGYYVRRPPSPSGHILMSILLSTFTAMSGDMLVPDLPTPGGTPYVWPGLQSNNGVLQAVLDGRSGTWWIGDGFYGTPSLSWGNGFNVYPGDTVHFEFSVVSCTPLRI